jgi:hypothetical protein
MCKVVDEALAANPSDAGSFGAKADLVPRLALSDASSAT